MEGAQCFIEVYKCCYGVSKTYHSPNCELANRYTAPIEELKEILSHTKRLTTLQTIAVWYIKPKVKSK